MICTPLPSHSSQILHLLRQALAPFRFFQDSLCSCGSSFSSSSGRWQNKHFTVIWWCWSVMYSNASNYMMYSMYSMYSMYLSTWKNQKKKQKYWLHGYVLITWMYYFGIKKVHVLRYICTKVHHVIFVMPWNHVYY